MSEILEPCSLNFGLNLNCFVIFSRFWVNWMIGKLGWMGDDWIRTEL